MDTATSHTHGSPSERELRVLELFSTRRRRLRFLAASRCPHDERLLAGVCRLRDGLWAWHAGSRLTPMASRTEVESWHLDRFDSEELGPEIYRRAGELADDVLGEARRYESPATVVSILGIDSDGTVRVGPWRGDRHALQFFASGLPLLQYASCGCRRAYQVQMLALVYAGLMADTGAIPAGRHVNALPVARLGEPADATALAYRFTARGVRVSLDER